LVSASDPAFDPERSEAAMPSLVFALLSILYLTYKIKANPLHRHGAQAAQPDLD
jgi:hypothetical protein